MTRVRAAVAASVLAVAVVVVLLVRGGDTGYRVKLDLVNANGLRTHSPVRVGGVAVGQVASVALGRGDQVQATLKLDGSHRLGAGATATIGAVNLLGEKYVDLNLGDLRRPQPSGAVIPARRVTQSVDLDQVLDVLDADTRTRLAILINEAGAALTGRSADFNSTIRQLPSSLGAATKLLTQVDTDNQALGRLIDRSAPLVATIAPARKQLTSLVDTAAGTVTTIAARRNQLRATLANAPDTLRSLRGFLVRLQGLTAPLGPAARNITSTTGPLKETLDQIKPVQAVAAPTLAEAKHVAPTLTELGVRATPVLRAAVPTVSAVSDLFQSTPSLARTLSDSAPDLFAITEGWSRAIQQRDGLGHVFRARAVVSTNLINSLVQQAKNTSSDPRRHAKASSSAQVPALTSSPGPSHDPGSSPAAPKLPSVGIPGVGDIVKTVTGAVPQVTVPPVAAPSQGPSSGGDAAKSLLDYLLG